MAHTFEHTLDEWAKNGTKSAPSSTLKSTGFVGGMKPPASVFNYQWDKIAKAITELQQYALTEDPSGGIWQQLAAVATSGNYNDLLNKPEFKAVATSGSYKDLTDAPTGFLRYTTTSASYTNNQYSIPLTHSRYICLLEGELLGERSGYYDQPHNTSFSFINKDGAKILSYVFSRIDKSASYYGTITVSYDNVLVHTATLSYSDSYNKCSAAGISGNSLLFGAGNYSAFDIGHNFIGNIYLMPF